MLREAALAGGTIRKRSSDGAKVCEFRYSSVVMVATMWKTSQLGSSRDTKPGLMIVIDLPIYG
jgi:hypothetical protein